jgi:uncharacterized protein with HEPN domain
MRRDELYLNDIIEAAGHVAEFLRETDFEAFRKSEFGSECSSAETDYHRGGSGADLG